MSKEDASTIKAREHLKLANRHIDRASKWHSMPGFLAGARISFENVAVELQANALTNAK